MLALGWSEQWPGNVFVSQWFSKTKILRRRKPLENLGFKKKKRHLQVMIRHTHDLSGVIGYSFFSAQL